MTAEGLRIPGRDHHRRQGDPDARRRAGWPTAPTRPRRSARTVAAFDGSVAIAAGAADAPDRLLLALRGSGQALYVGLAEDAFVVASEPYGLVEETPRYLRMDGEAPAVAAARARSSCSTATGAGTLDGIRRLAYDGTDAARSTDDELAARRDHHPRHRPRPATPTSS